MTDTEKGNKSKPMAQAQAQAQGFDDTYPNIARWVNEFGWVEIGQDHYSQSFVRAIDEGGVMWEGKKAYQSIEHAMKELDAALYVCIQEYYGE